MSNSLWPHGLQHARPPCASPPPGAYSNSCLLSWWYHPTISSSVVPFSSHLESFPASGSFPMSQFFTSGVQNIGVSASVSVNLMNIQDWFPLGWTGWISLLSKGLSRVFSNTTIQKHQFFGTKLFFIVQLSHPYMTTGKTIALIWQAFVGNVMSLLFNMRSTLVITFLQVDFKGIILPGIMGKQRRWGGSAVSSSNQLKKLKSRDWGFLRMKQFSLKTTAWETLHETRHCWPALQIWVSRVQPGFPASRPAQRTSELSAPTSPWSNSLK